MSDHPEPSMASVRLRRFSVVPMTPVRDYFRLNGSSVVAESELDAWLYLTEAAQWREPVTPPRLRTHYRMVPQEISGEYFRGTKSEWIQSVHLGYSPAPVRLSPEARTQERLDIEETLETKRHYERVRELNKLTPWESIRHWLGKQKDHPIRWKLFGVLALGILGVILWQLVLAILMDAAVVVVFLWLVKR